MWPNNNIHSNVYGAVIMAVTATFNLINGESVAACYKTSDQIDQLGL